MSLRKRVKKNTSVLIIWPPTWGEDLPFQNAWSDYLTVRKQKRQPITQHGANLLAKKLLAATIEAATIALRKSAENGWTGVFLEDTGHRPKEKPGASEPKLDLW